MRIATFNMNKTRSTKTPDMLDLLLMMSNEERNKVLNVLNEGKKMADDINAVYGKEEEKQTGGLVWVC